MHLAGCRVLTYRVLWLLRPRPLHQRRNSLRRRRPHLLANHANPLHHHGRLSEHLGRGRVSEAVAVDLTEDVLCDGIACNTADDILTHLDLVGQFCVADAALHGHHAGEFESVNGMQVDQIDMLRVFVSVIDRYSSQKAKKGVLTARIWLCTCNLGPWTRVCSSIVSSIKLLCKALGSSGRASILGASGSCDGNAPPSRRRTAMNSCVLDAMS